MAEIFNDSNFQQEVLSAKEPVFVDFYAEWCNPCKKIAPLIQELAEEYKGRVKVGKVNVDESPNSTNRFHIMAVPTMLILVNGEVKETIEGANITKKELMAKIDRVL
ncbi:MAG: thioredoxin [Lachnospiraceae bacterium]|nr:thioredoxin [Lachnospiraceae bacterium]